MKRQLCFIFLFFLFALFPSITTASSPSYEQLATPIKLPKEDPYRLNELAQHHNPLKKSLSTIRYFKKEQNAPEKILVVYDHQKNSGWGDYILESRKFLTRLIKTWDEEIQEVVILTDYPDVYKGLDGRIKSNSKAEPFSFDLLIDMRKVHGNDKPIVRRRNLTRYLKTSLYQVQPIIPFYQTWKFLDFIVSERGNFPATKLENSKTYHNLELMLESFELSEISPPDYLLRKDKSFQILEDKKTTFVNFLRNTNKEFVQASAVYWAGVIHELIKEGRKVVINGGTGSKEDQALLKSVLSFLGNSYESLPKNLTIRTFQKRKEVIEFMDQEVESLLTIDTGLFWAATHIVGIPTVVIINDSVLFEKEQEIGFTSMTQEEFIATPLKTLELLPRSKNVQLEFPFEAYSSA